MSNYIQIDKLGCFGKTAFMPHDITSVKSLMKPLKFCLCVFFFCFLWLLDSLMLVIRWLLVRLGIFPAIQCLIGIVKFVLHKKYGTFHTGSSAQNILCFTSENFKF